MGDCVSARERLTAHCCCLRMVLRGSTLLCGAGKLLCVSQSLTHPALQRKAAHHSVEALAAIFRNVAVQTASFLPVVLEVSEASACTRVCPAEIILPTAKMVSPG